MPPVPNVRAEYRGTIGTLQTIESTWNEVVCGEQLYFGFCCSLEEVDLQSQKFLEHSNHYPLYICKLHTGKLSDIEDCSNAIDIL